MKLLSVFLLLSLTGCGNSTEESQITMLSDLKQAVTEDTGVQKGEISSNVEDVQNVENGENTESIEGEETKIPDSQSSQGNSNLTENQNVNNSLQSTSNSAQSGTESTSSQPITERKEVVFSSEDWGLSFGESGTQPVGNAPAEDMAGYHGFYVGGKEEKVIYLTFDCGYENGNTEPILDALKKHNAIGTFFVVGHFLETAPDLVKRMVEEGHIVGNHTYHHPDMSSISTIEDFKKELDDVANLFYDITGTQLSPYYRPPQGKCNAENLKMADELGYSTIFWSLAYVDWDTEKQPSHDAAFDKLTSRIHPGAIVLLHNTSKTNGEILDELLTKWEDMGYTFKPLSDLAAR